MLNCESAEHIQHLGEIFVSRIEESLAARVTFPVLL